MARPTAPTQPPTKKAKPNTRSQSAQMSTSNSEPTPSPSPDLDDDDDEPFEYESDFGSAEMEKGEEDADDQLEEDDEMSGAPPKANTGRREKRTAEVLVLSSDPEDEGTPVAPPEIARPPPKGKMTARKQFSADVGALVERFGGTLDPTVQNFKRDEGEDTVRFAIELPTYRLKLTLMYPELSGYPDSHEVMCFSENESLSPEVELVMSEVAKLPGHADRSLQGVLEYLLHRIVRGEPSTFFDETKQSQGNETDEELDFEDDFTVGGLEMTKNGELAKALRRDFKELVKEGYRPGFTRVSELDLVVSVSKKVSALGVPVRALQAWDSQLITGEVVYLVLLMSFASYPVNLDDLKCGQVKFKVGISPNYKPSKAAVAAAFRSHSSNTYTKGEFEALSLSAPLDALMLNEFQKILVTRRCNPATGWAAAESHCLVPGMSPGEVDKKKSKVVDKEELDIAKSTKLPKDPMRNKRICNNYPLLAVAYIVRRFVLCPRFCLICYKRCDAKISGALKPFVCESELCLFQFMSLGLGPSLEHEIVTNSSAVDLLVQLAYVAAKEGRLTGDLLPKGLGLQVPATNSDGTWKQGEAVVEFDSLETDLARQNGVVSLILQLPAISEMKKWLLGENLTDAEKLMNRNRKITDMGDGAISSSAWKLLRWIIASNTSYLKQIEDEDELIKGIPKEYRQFRFVVGSPAKEHLLAENVKAAQALNPNTVAYPTVFAWHGSSVKNFHSILREGLHFKETINGRAYGHGCYFAIEGNVSMGHYAQAAATAWKNAEFAIGKMAALAEIVNLPGEFVSRNPYLVVNQLDWIQCRYLIVQKGLSLEEARARESTADSTLDAPPRSPVKTIPLDPAIRLTLNNAKLEIPDVVDKLERMEAKLEDAEEELNNSDLEIIKEPTVVIEGHSSPPSGLKRGDSVLYSPSKTNKQDAGNKIDTFVPCNEQRLSLVKLLPPPKSPSRSAMITIQRELKGMVSQQKKEGSIEAGFYLDPERSNDNIFTWVIELPMESFDRDLPLVKDMKDKSVKSLLMEIRFGDNFPFSPPFFRVVHPRFLPFIQGGGGHVTGGGSICMDLLTSDGWLSSYSISAVLLQIRMAMSNLEPRPARLDPRNWNAPYSMDEAIAGFRRAASTHGWKVPDELDAIAKGL